MGTAAAIVDTTMPGGPGTVAEKAPGRGDARDDERLIAACLRGEQEAWEALLQRYGRLIYSIPVRYGLSQEEAADVYQTVCVTLLEKLDGLRDRAKLSSWLITVTTRECWALTRRRRPIATFPASAEDNVIEEADDQPLPEEMALQWEEQHMVRAAMQRLPERCQKLIWYLFYDRSCPSYVEISRRMGIPTASMGPTRARCLEKLRGILEQTDR